MEGAVGVGVLAAELEGGDRRAGLHAGQAELHAVMQQGLVVVGQVLEREGDFARTFRRGVADGGGDVVRLVEVDAQVGEGDRLAEGPAQQRSVGLEHEDFRGATGFLTRDAELPVAIGLVLARLRRDHAHGTAFADRAGDDDRFDGEAGGEVVRLGARGEEGAAMTGGELRALAVAERDLLRLEVAGDGRGDHGGGALAAHFVEEGGGALGFGGGRRAGVEELVETADLRGLVARGVGGHAAREGLAALQHERAVEQQQRLDRRGGHVARGRAAEPLRGVEDVGQRIAVVAHDAREDAADRVAVDHAGAGLLLGLELAAGGVEGVADLLGLEALRLEAPEEGVLRVLELAAGDVGVLAGAAVGGARHQQASHRLLVPALGHELIGEPVEELGVRGRFAEVAEVAGVGREAAAEAQLPEAVHRQARGEGVGLVGQPAGERGAAAGGSSVRHGRDGLGRGRVLRAEDGEEGRRDDGVLLRDDGVEALGAGLADGQDVRRFDRLEFVVFGELTFQVGVLDAGLALDEAIKAVVFVIDLAPGEGGDLLFVGRALRRRLIDHRLDVVGEDLDGLAGRRLPVLKFERGNLVADRLGLRFPLRPLAGVLGGLRFGPGDAVFDRYGIVEEAAERVVVALQDRVELVVVAAGALHAGAEEDVAGGVGDVVQDVLPLAASVAVVVFVVPMAEVAEGRERVGVAREEFVAGDLLLHEAVVGLVVVIGLDDVIAVAPGGGTEVVDAEAVAVGVAHEVEPRAGHALAVGRGGEQAVDKFEVGRGILVLDERGDLFGRGREAGQVEGDAADEHGALGFAGGREAFLGETGVDETIDRVSGGAGGQFGAFDRLISPPGFFLRADGARQVAAGDGRLGAALRPGGAGLHPSLEQADFFLREAFALRGHHLVGIGR